MKLGMLILSALVDVAEICIVKKASSTIQEKIKKSFFHNLKILFIFMLGVSAIYFFPGKKISLLFFSTAMLISIAYKAVPIIITISHPKNWKMISQCINLFSIPLFDNLLLMIIKPLIHFIGKVILRILPSVILFAIYILTVTFIVKPILLDTVAEMSMLQIYLYPIVYAINCIFKVDSFSWINL
jgi:hypothetical protein